MKSIFSCSCFILLFLNNALGSEDDPPCTKTGPTCTSDCRKAVLCTEINKPPHFDLQNCYGNTTTPNDQKSYCQIVSGEPTCGAKLPKCDDSQTSVKVICGGVARFPHPLKPSASITCREYGKPPSETCYCPIPQIANRNDATVQCVADTAPPAAPVSCTPPSGSIGDDNSKFVYFCVNNTIWVSLKIASSRSFTQNSVANTRDVGTCEQGSSNGNPPSGGNPPNGGNPPSGGNPPTDPSSPVQCTKKGELFADPEKCNGYYFCNKNLEPEKRDCPDGKHFSDKLKTCVNGTC